MTRRAARTMSASVAFALVAAATAGAQSPAEIQPVLRCQKTFAKHGARFANKTIKYTLKCTNEIVECQVNCDGGVYGPPCSTNPPPCCDPDDPESMPAFEVCMEEANEKCARENEKIEIAEGKKSSSIFSKCSELTTEQLCGATTPGLNFVALNAGCEQLIPGYECNVQGLLDCVGGPMQQELGEQIAELLDPRAGEALSAAGINGTFTGIARVFKVEGELAADKIDVYRIDGRADERIVAYVKNGDNDADGTSSLGAVLTYIAPDGTTTVGDTNVVGTPCSLPSACGATCPQFKRRFPTTGTYFLAVEASTALGCGGDSYQLVVKNESGNPPILYADDIDAISP